jgi:hypothetical protein
MSEFDTHEHGSEGTQEPGGLGPDGTIPDDPDGLGATTTDEPSTFEPEEDEAADASVADAGDHPSEPSGDGPSSASAAEGGDADPMQDAGLGV